MKIKSSELKDIVIQILSSKYYTKEEASKMAEVFLYAEASGKNTQGLLKLLGTEPAQNIRPKHKIKVIKKTPLSTLIDGGGAAGPLAAQFATDESIKIATKKGMAIVSVNNTFSSIGTLGFYVRKIAQHDLIGIAMANSPKVVIPFNGKEPTFGTNPLAFGFPTTQYPITFDMASSAITWYGLIRAKALGLKIPKNVAMNADGNITTNPSNAMQGGVLPFDRSYKGSGLAMVVEIMAGVLSGSSYVFDHGDWGTTFITISPDLLIGTNEFKKNTSDLIKKIKKTKTIDQQKIHIPGYDNEQQIAQTLNKGTITIDQEIFNQLRAQL